MSAKRSNNEDDPPMQKARKIDSKSSSGHKLKMKVTEKVENILQLPVEMIAEILSYVPDHQSVSLTCKKLNDISCNTKFFTLKFQSRGIRSFTSFQDDRKVFSSMMKSNRRFKSLSIQRCGYDSSEIRLDRLMQVIQRFGKNIEGLDVLNIELPRNFVELLNFMPNLKKIELYYISDSSLVIQGELKLFKMKEIISYGCRTEDLRLFNQLPPGVLQELRMRETKTSTDQVIQLFTNQPNITKITTNHVFAKSFDWSQTKLKWLRTKGEIDLKDIVKGQNEVEYFESKCRINQALLTQVCNELKSLVHWKLRFVDFQEIPELKKLKKLKTLDITGSKNATNENFNRFLSFMDSSSVEKLSIECWFLTLKESTITQLASNLPHLKELKIETKSSINIINTILNNFPKLEILNFGLRVIKEADNFNYQEGLKHKKLKNLCIRAWNAKFNKDLAKLIGCCPKLEELDLQFASSTNSLKEILKLQPNLKSLSLYVNELLKITHEDIAALKEDENKLEKFNFCPCVLGDSTVKLEEEFKEQFQSIKIEYCFCDKAKFWWKMEKIL